MWLKAALLLAAFVSLILALSWVVEGLKGQGYIGGEVERCNASGGEWLRAYDGYACFQVSRINP